MPMPSALLVKNGSKTSFNLSSGMPEPRSDTDSSAKFSTREVRMLMMRFSARRILHRVDPVHDKVQNDLLKLNAVAEDRKRIRCDHVSQFEFSSNGSAEKIRLVSRTRSLRSNFSVQRRLFQQAAHPPNDFAGAPVVLQNISQDFVQFLDVGFGDFRIACAVSALVRIEPSGWFIS